MIILDTNVVSESMKAAGDANVFEWLKRQAPETLYLTTTSLSELLVGIEVLPEGRRKHGLLAALNQVLSVFFEERILPFHLQAARAYGPLVARARAAGRAISMADAQIAAIAACHQYPVATRDSAPFEAAGILVVNPWTAK